MAELANHVRGQVYTFISTDWAGTGQIIVSSRGEYQTWQLTPSDYFLSNQIKTIVYKVPIIDDPVTPGDETSLYDFDYLTGDVDVNSWGGNYTLNGVVDDDGDFSSPFFSFSNYNKGFWGPFALAGIPQELYVRLEIFVSSVGAWVNSFRVSFWQAQDPVSTKPTSWGAIKSLYH